MRGVEQLLIALRATAQRTGTPGFDQPVYSLRDGLPQFGRPQTLIVGAEPDAAYLRMRYPVLHRFRYARGFRPVDVPVSAAGRKPAAALTASVVPFVRRALGRHHEPEAERSRRDVAALAEAADDVGKGQRPLVGDDTEERRRIELEPPGAVIVGRHRDEQVAPVLQPLQLAVVQEAEEASLEGIR